MYPSILSACEMHLISEMFLLNSHPASLSPLAFGSGNGISGSGSYPGLPRDLSDPYSTNHLMSNRSPLTHTPANFNDMSKYAMAPPRATDPYSQSFSQSGSDFHQPPTSIETSSRSS